MMKTAIIAILLLSVAVGSLTTGKRLVKRSHRFVDVSRITGQAIINETNEVFENPTKFWAAMRQKPKLLSKYSEQSQNANSSNPFEDGVIESWKDADTTEYEVTGFDQEYQAGELQISSQLLDELEKHHGVKLNRAADCGAGIGRVTNHLLAKRFNKVDLYERSAKLLHFAQSQFKGNPAIGDFYVVDLKAIKFMHKYDVIWVQMVAGYFDDEEIVAFYKKCKNALTPSGVVVFKDYVSPTYALHFKLNLAEVFRSREYNRLLFQEAGLQVIYTAPLDPADVDSYTQYYQTALRPIERCKKSGSS